MNKVTAEEVLLESFIKIYGTEDAWELEDFFPKKDLKATLEAMEAYKNQSSVSDEEDLEPSKEQDSKPVASHSSTSDNSNQQ